MDSSALEQYHRTRVETGSPVRVVAMLYDGALRFLNEARDAIESGDIPRRADRINRTLRIVQELGNTLDHTVESDLPQKLAALYEYVEFELLEASRQNSTAPLDNAGRILAHLAEAWRELAESNAEVPTSLTESETTRRESATPSHPSLSISA